MKVCVKYSYEERHLVEGVTTIDVPDDLFTADPEIDEGDLIREVLCDQGIEYGVHPEAEVIGWLVTTAGKITEPTIRVTGIHWSGSIPSDGTWDFEDLPGEVFIPVSALSIKGKDRSEWTEVITDWLEASTGVYAECEWELMVPVSDAVASVGKQVPSATAILPVAREQVEAVAPAGHIGRKITEPTIRLFGIEWETDGKTVDLPSEVCVEASKFDLKDDEDRDQRFASWLSDEFDHLVKDFQWELMVPVPPPADDMQVAREREEVPSATRSPGDMPVVREQVEDKPDY